MKKSPSAGKQFLGFFFLAVIAGWTACAPEAGDRPRLIPAPDDSAVRIAEAQGLVKRGHYAAFKKAAALYQGVYARPGRQKNVAYAYVRALILLRVRECRIGIIFSSTAETARAIVRDNPELRGLLPLVDLADLLSSTRPSQGIQTDINQVQVKHGVDDIGKLRTDLRTKTAGEDFYAYLYVVFFGAMAGYSDQIEDLSPYYGLFPDSPLMLYANAVRDTKEQPDILVRLAKADPEFYEAHFHLGEIALAERNLLSAERNFLKALPELGGSPQETIYLASIYTATEEFEKGLEFYDRTLELSPEYRDAILGKAICQSYLGRTAEAIQTLDKMIALGNWLMGEAHYWLAWNYHSLKDEAAAQRHIEESKGRLPTNAEVFGLAGSIALDRNETDRAEKEFLEALRYNGSHTEAIFGMGRINDIREKWPAAAGWYETASKVVGDVENALRGKIAEIKAAPLTEDRRAAMLSKKESQLRVARATLALACYNAAAAWVNAGFKERARPWAEKAAAHPQFKDQAAALMAKIKKN